MLSGATVWEFGFEDRYNCNFLSFLLQVAKMSIFFLQISMSEKKNYPIMTSHMTQDGHQREIYRVFSCHYFKVIGYKLIF